LGPHFGNLEQDVSHLIQCEEGNKVGTYSWLLKALTGVQMTVTELQTMLIE
jgi:hypothetical protein